MRLTKNKHLLHYSLAALLAVGALTTLGFTQKVHAAATMSQVFVRFDRMQISTATTGTVCAKPATTSANVKTWTVTFPTGYTVSTTAGNWTTNTTSTNMAWPSGAAAWPNGAAATPTISGQTVTWTNTSVQTMNNTTLYCYNWTNSAAVSVTASASPTNSGTIATLDNTTTTIDTGVFTTASITNDQIVVTATVPPAFSFALSGNTDGLGNLSTGSVTASPTPRTATVNTNAKNGWMVWAKDAGTSGLTSASASYTIPTNCSSGAGTNSTLSAGTEGYNTGVTSTLGGGTGTITVATPFVGGSAGKGGGLCATNLQTLASSGGTATNAVLTLTNNVAIAGSTPAATDYTDTITVVGAGLF